MSPAVISKESLVARLAPYSQEHLVQFWDELSDAERQHLAAQIEKVDLPLIESLSQGKVDQPDWAELSRRAEPPPAVRLGEASEAQAHQAIEHGTAALQAGKVGVLLVAGGQGSRLGFDLPKSMYPIGPISGASLLQIHIEKVRANSRRYGAAIPLYVMTSPATHEDTVRFLQENKNFGLAADDLVVFCQGTMPAIGIDSGKLLLAEKGELFLSPDGHGGTVGALGASGALGHMRSRGIEQLFYLQVDNPLVPIGDSQLIGYHLLTESELTSIAVQKKHPHEKWGNFAMIDGRMHVIEYSDIPDEVAELRDADGHLKFWAGSLAIHVFERALLERALELKDMMPFHIARKKVPFINEKGEKINPREPNALKFERFIFDLLPQAARPLVVEYREPDCLAPLKNASGAAVDTPEYVREMLLAMHRRWLEAAGAKLAEGIDVEISPLFALDAAQVAERVKPGQSFDKSQYLTPT
jgi:UDP-N-acetylglucosamine/UDP-N-acetylgalactosamine diphosphorylase